MFLNNQAVATAWMLRGRRGVADARTQRATARNDPSESALALSLRRRRFPRPRASASLKHLAAADPRVRHRVFRGLVPRRSGLGFIEAATRAAAWGQTDDSLLPRRPVLPLRRPPTSSGVVNTVIFSLTMPLQMLGAPELAPRRDHRPLLEEECTVNKIRRCIGASLASSRKRAGAAAAGLNVTRARAPGLRPQRRRPPDAGPCWRAGRHASAPAPGDSCP